MHTERIGRSTIKVSISKSELDAAGLNISDINSADPLICRLAQRLCPNADKGMISVEVFPSRDAGCIIYISQSVGDKEFSSFKAIITADSAEKNDKYMSDNR